MTLKTHHMINAIDAIDPMILALRADVTPVLADATRFRFELCVTEALTNLVVHAPTDAEDAPIEIALTLQTREVQIEIFDPKGAEPFDLRAHAAELSQIDVMAEGGRGLALIMECADTIQYGPKGTRYALSLTFRDGPSEKHTATPEKGINT